MNKLQYLDRSVLLKLSSNTGLLIGLDGLFCGHFPLLLCEVSFESRHNQRALNNVSCGIKTFIFLSQTVLNQLKGIFETLIGNSVIRKYSTDFVLIDLVEY